MSSTSPNWLRALRWALDLLWLAAAILSLALPLFAVFDPSLMDAGVPEEDAWVPVRGWEDMMPWLALLPYALLRAFALLVPRLRSGARFRVLCLLAALLHGFIGLVMFAPAQDYSPYDTMLLPIAASAFAILRCLVRL